MKQHITVEQLKELNKIQLDKIAKFLYIPLKEMKNMELFDDIKETIYQEICEQINIGKMIEILETYSKTNQNYQISFGSNHVTYIVELWEDYNFNPIAKYEEYTLCDALWKAVKKVIFKIKG